MASKQREIINIIEKLESKKSLLEAHIFNCEQKLQWIKLQITEQYTKGQIIENNLKQNQTLLEQTLKQLKKSEYLIIEHKNTISDLENNNEQSKTLQIELQNNLGSLRTNIIKEQNNTMDLESNIVNLKTDIGNKLNQCKELDWAIKQKQTILVELQKTIHTEDKFLQSIKKEYTKIEQDKIYIEEEKSNLIIRERNISLKEKRLNDLEQKLFSNK